jgi:phage tail sheath protein FI
MATYKTPGVYVEEVSTLPPSVAEVATAIPAFIGYTEKAVDAAGAAVTGVMVKRIISMLEYRQYFGGPRAVPFKATVKGADTEITKSDLKFILYYSMKLYFENGGGPCYIVSVGRYASAEFKVDEFKSGLDAIKLVDEPTLLLFPDAVNLSSIADYCNVANAALAQCNELGDRFTVMDVGGDENMAAEFRNNILSETNFLKYGAAYTPYLNTLISYEFLEEDVTVKDETKDESSAANKKYSIELTNNDPPNNGLKVTYSGPSRTPQVMVVQNAAMEPDVTFETFEKGLLIIRTNTAPAFVKTVLAAWEKFEPKGGFSLASTGAGIEISTDAEVGAATQIRDFTGNLAGVKESDGSTTGDLLKIDYHGPTNLPIVNLAADANLGDDAVEFGVNKDSLTIRIKNKITVRKIKEAWDAKAREFFSIAKIEDGEATAPGAATMVEVKQWRADKLPGTATKFFFRIDYRGTADSQDVIMERGTATATEVDFDTSTEGKLKILFPPVLKDDGTIDADAPPPPVSFEAILSKWQDQGGFSIQKAENLTAAENASFPAKSLEFTASASTFTEIGDKEFTVNIPKESPHFIEVNYKGGAAPTVAVKVNAQANANEVSFKTLKDDGTLGTIEILLRTTGQSASSKPARDIINFWTLVAPAHRNGFDLKYVTPGHTIATKEITSLTEEAAATTAVQRPEVLLSALKSGGTAVYNQVKQAMGKQRLTLPPSPAMAGIYARVDRSSGVWKTPANVSVIGVSGPTHLITNADQENLNVDATSGKSINAIRPFTGKGTLVWGGRTLAGNDNEWRYISVRRLFNLIEESIQKATSFAVFEANDATTWLKVKAMIDSFLYGLWQQGALAGPTPGQAFFVQVGLGKTMNTQDILEGRMIIEVGIAAVRPAEFIILRFSHKLQEA